MYTSTKTGDWDSPWDLISFLVVAFEAIRGHAQAGLEIGRRASELHKEEMGDGPMRPEREASVHVRHLRNLQPMDEQVAEGVLAYGDTLRWAERKMRGMLAESDDTVGEAAESFYKALKDEGVSLTAREHIQEGLAQLRELPNVDAYLEMEGYGRREELGEMEVVS